MRAVDTEVIASRALGCWERVTQGPRPIELYVRLSERRRIERSAVREIHDAGNAVRAFFDHGAGAGFGACVGFSDVAIESATHMADSRRHPVLESTPLGR